jgi:hypothetical protein
MAVTKDEEKLLFPLFLVKTKKIILYRETKLRLRLSQSDDVRSTLCREKEVKSKSIFVRAFPNTIYNLRIFQYMLA